MRTTSFRIRDEITQGTVDNIREACLLASVVRRGGIVGISPESFPLFGGKRQKTGGALTKAGEPDVSSTYGFHVKIGAEGFFWKVPSLGKDYCSRTIESAKTHRPAREKPEKTSLRRLESRMSRIVRRRRGSESRGFSEKGASVALPSSGDRVTVGRGVVESARRGGSIVGVVVSVEITGPLQTSSFVA